MNKIVTESIGNARNNTLLGGRLQLIDGQLILSEQDSFHPNTQYYYIAASSNKEDFLNNIRRHYVNYGAVQIFDKAKITYELKYLPVLKCGDKLLTLNNEDDDFITENYFSKPLQWNSSWDGLLKNVTDGCLTTSKCSLLRVNLSFKEISYLVSRFGLVKSNQLQIIFLPFHCAVISCVNKEYHVAQIALRNTELEFDYPFFDDSTFFAIIHLLLLIFIYGIFVVFAINNIDQSRQFFEDYGTWWKIHLPLPDLSKSLDSIIPIIGWLIGMVLDLVLIILYVIFIIGIVPAIALIIPAFLTYLLATSLIKLRRFTVKRKKEMLFSKSVKRS